jgi:hypothetical protein
MADLLGAMSSYFCTVVSELPRLGETFLFGKFDNTNTTFDIEERWSRQSQGLYLDRFNISLGTF